MTYDEIRNYVKNAEEEGKMVPLTGENQDGDPVLVEEGTIDGDHVYIISTCQKNGWIRKNIYHEDGVIEETFER